jgi:hypothetical protein
MGRSYEMPCDLQLAEVRRKGHNCRSFGQGVPYELSRTGATLIRPGFRVAAIALTF